MLVFRGARCLTQEPLSEMRWPSPTCGRWVRSAVGARRTRSRPLEAGRLSHGRRGGLRRLAWEREQDRAGGILGQAARRLALNAISADTVHASFDEAGPHASVDSTCIRTPDDEGTERAGRRRQFGPVALERHDGGLEAERAERIADLLESGRNVSRRLQARCGSERAAEILARLAERSPPAASGNLLHQNADQLGQAPVGKFDPFELRGDAIDLGRAPRSRPAPAAAPLARDREESGLDEPIEPAARNVSMHVQRSGRLRGGERVAANTRVHEDPPKLRIAGRFKTIKRHSRKSYPRPVWEAPPGKALR